MDPKDVFGPEDPASGAKLAPPVNAEILSDLLRLGCIVGKPLPLSSFVRSFCFTLCLLVSTSATMTSYKNLRIGVDVGG